MSVADHDDPFTAVACPLVRFNSYPAKCPCGCGEDLIVVCVETGHGESDTVTHGFTMTKQAALEMAEKLIGLGGGW